jgi:branched-chain amino acid transport system substrate-binding protein
MKRKKVFILLTSVCLCLMLVTPLVVVPGYAAPKEKPPVKIGAVIWLTGGAASLGDEEKRGFELAAKWFNDRGGILGGRKVEFAYYDEGYTAEQIVVSAKRAIADGCHAVVGGGTAGTSYVMQQVVKKAGIPIVVCISSDEKMINDPYWGSFHVNTTVRVEARAANRFIEAVGAKTVVYIAYDNAYNDLVKEATLEMWDRPDSPVKLLDWIKFPFGVADMRMELTKAVGLKPDLIFCSIWGKEMIVSGLKILDELGYQGKVIPCAWSCYTPDVLKAAGRLAGDTYGLTKWFPDPNIPECSEFLKTYDSMNYAVGPSDLMHLSYLGAMILLKGMDAAGTDSDLKKIADAIHNIDYTAPTGLKVKIADNGQIVSHVAPIFQVQNGKPVKIHEEPIYDDDWTFDIR